MWEKNRFSNSKVTRPIKSTSLNELCWMPNCHHQAHTDGYCISLQVLFSAKFIISFHV